MGLTEQEAAILAKLMKKKDEPDAPQHGRSFNITVDLGDEKQVERARRLGLSDLLGLDDTNGDGDSGEGAEGEEAPKRRGFFE